MPRMRSGWHGGWPFPVCDQGADTRWCTWCCGRHSLCGDAGRNSSDHQSTASEAAVTSQTKASGEKVRWVYVEEAFDIEQEIYAAVVVNRSRAELELLVSGLGGGDIEEKASADPTVIARFPLTVTTSGPAGDFLAAAERVGLSGPGDAKSGGCVCGHGAACSRA